MHSKNLWYQMQMNNMQMQMQKMQMQMRMQTPVLHTTTVQVPSIPLTPLSVTIRRNLYPLQLPLHFLTLPMLAINNNPQPQP
jgi:hypothetical protein